MQSTWWATPCCYKERPTNDEAFKNDLAQKQKRLEQRARERHWPGPTRRPGPGLSSFEARQVDPDWAALVGVSSDSKCRTHALTCFAARFTHLFFFIFWCNMLSFTDLTYTATNMAKPVLDHFRKKANGRINEQRSNLQNQIHHVETERVQKRDP